MSGRAAVRIELEQAERAELETRARRRKSFRADAMRAEIVLLAATGLPNLVIAKRLGLTRTTVTTRRRRFATRRLDGLADAPRPGAPRKIGDEKINQQRWRVCRLLLLIGAPGLWRKPRAYPFRPCTAFGELSRCSRIAARPS